MLGPVARFIDDYRIWHKVTFQRGRILETRSDRWREFDRPEECADPADFYPGHARAPILQTTGVAETDRARVVRFRFPSRHPIQRYPFAETNIVTGRFYWRRGPDAPVVVLGHGWAHDSLRAVETIYVEPLLEAGFSVALPVLSFHLERKPAGTYSGELMVSGDVVLTVEGFRQSVADLSGLVSWLRQAGHDKVGLLGYSLGGYVSGLVACLRADLDFVVIGAAGDSIVSPILDTDLGVNVREDLARTGMRERKNLEQAWGMISPGRLRLRIPKENVLLVAGLYDRIMLEESVRRLWDNWGRPPLSWQPQGHYSLLAVPGRLIRKSLPFLGRVAPPGA